MANKKEYSVVLVEYHSKDHILKCIKSLENQTLRPKEIVVVNNGSDAQTLEALKESQYVRVINPGSNLGYAKAANIGIANTTSHFIATINPDIELEPTCAELIIDLMSKDEKIGAVGPMIMESNGEIYPSARIEPGIKIALGHAVFSLFKKDNKYSRIYQNVNIDKENATKVDWVSGAAIFSNRDALNKVGMWDERYFMYCEDLDLCHSLRQNGFDVIYLPQAKIDHVGGGSSGEDKIKLLYIHHKSLYLYVQKKYKNNLPMKILAGVFVAIRFPLAVIKSKFRID